MPDADANREQLTQTLAVLERQLIARERELQILKETISNVRQLIGTQPMREPSSRQFAGLSIAEAAKQWFKQRNGEPATTRKIAEALLDNGVVTASKDFNVTLYTVLHTSPLFRRTGDGKWAYVEGVQPEAAPPPQPASFAAGKRLRGRLVKKQKS